LSLSSSVVQVSGSTLTGGTWSIGPGTTLSMTGNITINSGSIILDGTGSTFAAISNLATNAGSFRILDGRNFSTPGGFSNTGCLFVGAGSVLNVGGNYPQPAPGSLGVQIGGSPASGTFSRIVATGSATLGGSLDIQLANGFGPTQGDNFPILSSSGTSGDF